MIGARSSLHTLFTMLYKPRWYLTGHHDGSDVLEAAVEALYSLGSLGYIGSD
jgi:hypothetical protein